MRTTIGLLLLLACGCHPLPEPVDPVDPAPDADCAEVCARMEFLGCESAKPTPEGTPCARVCQDIQDSGLIQWNLNCRAAAVSCEAADNCER